MEKLLVKQEVSAKIRGFNLGKDLENIADFLQIPEEKLSMNHVVQEAFQFTARIARERLKNNNPENHKSLPLSFSLVRASLKKECAIC